MKHREMKTKFMTFVYGLTCPVGIAIGAVIMEAAGQSMNTDLIYGVLQGITTGVFIYVTFFEIFLHEIAHDVKLVSLLAVLLGFAVTAALAILHHHSKQGDSSDRTYANLTTTTYNISALV